MKNNHLKTVGLYLLILLLILGFTAAGRFLNGNSLSDKYSYSDLIADINSNNIEYLLIQPDAETTDAGTVEAHFRDFENTYALVNISSINQFMTSIEDKIEDGSLDVRTIAPSKANNIFSIIITIATIIIIASLFFFLIQQMNGGGGKVMNFGKSRAKLINGDKNGKTFKDVAGLHEEKEDVKELVDFLKNPKKFVEIGARIPKGVLFVGPPGTGKTLLAKAIAGEAEVPFFTISGSDFVEMFVGVGASRVRDLFEQAKKNTPSLIFIDEIDAVGRRRGAGLGGGHDEREQTLNQLLVEMDGFGVNEGVIIIAATNRPDILDPALLRPGRFDRQITIGRPDVRGREEILKVHAKNKKMAEDIDFADLAKITSGFTGADLENLLNEAALLAARKDKKIITQDEIGDAFIRVGMGTEKKSRVVSEKERKITAYHEAGHAILQELQSELGPVHMVSIIPVGSAGGYTMPLPSEEMFYSKKKMEQMITMTYGGRAAEEIIFKDITTGASSDIEKASQVARNMVMRFGMSEKLGPIQFGDNETEVFLGNSLGHQRNYGEDIAGAIDAEVNRIASTCYDEAIRLLNENIDALHKTVDLLLEKERVTGEEFREVLNKKEEA